jgi:hypothetical protein
MKPRNPRFIFVCLLCLITFNLAKGQEVTPKASSSKPSNAPVREKPKVASPQEIVIRAAYEKLTMFNKAALLIENPPNKSLNEDLFLRFELHNFRTGPIPEILPALHREIQTNAAGEIIDITRSVTQLNKEEEHVAYRAEWTTGQYASGYDPYWTIGDLLGFEPNLYHDVGQYALYDVTVSFQGKTRTYRALALFHNPYGSTKNLKPSFWDGVVGSGGVLTDVWNEKRPPVGERVVPSKTGATPVEPVSYLGHLSPSQVLEPTAFASESYSETSSPGDVVESTTEDRSEHITGAHGEMVRFQGSCSAQSGNEQFCSVDFVFRYTYENGTTSNLFFTHRNRVHDRIDTATGPRGIPITCHTGRGVATRNCLNPQCTFTATLIGSGANMQMTGGDVWNGQLVHSQTCNIPAADVGGCTTPGFNGTCPPGTLPNGNGLCCPSSGTCVLGALYAPQAQAPSPLLISPGCCDDVERLLCFQGGGEWQESTCSCYSPIVIDVVGNGFNLTNPANGVPFDITGNGVSQQISWTSADSDDAWLALDRNGNGTIDDGRELFGSSTAQPYLSPGESKNGFRALAMFDKAEYGGNSDGQIDSSDTVFFNLKLWQDRNHNGVSEANELQSLSDSEVRAIELHYQESKRRDEHGNWFRYRARVKDARGAQVGRWAWDVFLHTTNWSN